MSKPDAYVFPGGATDAADANGAWMEHFTKKEIKQLTPKSPKLERPPLYVTPNDEEIPRDLSLRIGAIRETFEESGILILEKNGEAIKAKHLPSRAELAQWRRETESSADAFIDVCAELDAYPAVNQLHEWSNWLTPPGILPKRFDTAFYVTAIDALPEYAAEDGGETVDLALMDPLEALDRSLKNEIILHPPQFVELSRMAKMSSIDVLLDYSSKRQDRGLHRWCPVQYMLDDCRLSAMVGDDLHEVVTDEIKVNDTYAELSSEQMAKRSTSLMRSLWSYQVNEKGKKIYGPMRNQTNLMFFDADSLQNTPLDHEQLTEVLAFMC